VDDLQTRLSRIDASANLDALRGLEGSAAAAYFDAFAAMVPEDLGFSGRQRRPPRDPVNSLLSFGYVLVGNELQSLLDGIGFDPFIGFFHALDYGRASLALDLLEEFRHALVDRLTISLLNRGIIKRTDFQTTPEGGLYLDQDGKRRYFTEYAKELTTPFTVDGHEITFGERVQYSVFECRLKEDQLALLRSRVAKLVDPEEDSVRFYRLCAECVRHIEIQGLGVVKEDPEIYLA
jgi:CRISPR-associated endonuclease Cas1